MLPTALIFAALAAQLPPTVVLPGTRYAEGEIPAENGAPALAICGGALRATTLALRTDPETGETSATVPCGASFLLVAADQGLLPGAAAADPCRLVCGSVDERGDNPAPGAGTCGSVFDAGLAQDRRTGDVLVHLGTETWRLRRTPFSDGGVRATLRAPDGTDRLLFESATPGAEVNLIWAGDLDGDGELDLVFTATEGLYRTATLVQSNPPEATEAALAL
jgi:hypothetical protein